MTEADWVAEAGRTLAVFRQAGLVVGLGFFLLTIVVRWKQLSNLGGPLGYVMGAALSGYALVQAFFPLYWMAWHRRPVSDIPADGLVLYVYAGAALSFLVGVIGVRGALDTSKKTS